MGNLVIVFMAFMCRSIRGAGAYEMKIPDRWKEYNLERAEYVIYVPRDWNLQDRNMKDY